jgi:hypothetical protein
MIWLLKQAQTSEWKLGEGDKHDQFPFSLSRNSRIDSSSIPLCAKRWNTHFRILAIILQWISLSSRGTSFSRLSVGNSASQVDTIHLLPIVASTALSTPDRYLIKEMDFSISIWKVCRFPLLLTSYDSGWAVARRRNLEYVGTHWSKTRQKKVLWAPNPDSLHRKVSTFIKVMQQAEAPSKDELATLHLSFELMKPYERDWQPIYSTAGGSR